MSNKFWGALNIVGRWKAWDFMNYAKQNGMRDVFPRTTKKWHGYGVEPTPVRFHISRKSGKIKLTGCMFIKVRRGHNVHYFPRRFKGLQKAYAEKIVKAEATKALYGTGNFTIAHNPLWNLYRVVSRVGTPDHVTHAIKTSKKKAV